MDHDIQPGPETLDAIARREAAARRLNRRKKLHFWTLVAVWLTASLVIAFTDLPPWGRALVAATPLIPLAALLLYLRRYAKHFDEFGRRIIVEAAATSFGVTVLLAFLYSLARMADIGIPRADWQPILATLWILFPIAVARASGRFK